MFITGVCVCIETWGDWSMWLAILLTSGGTPRTCPHNSSNSLPFSSVFSWNGTSINTVTSSTLQSPQIYIEIVCYCTICTKLVYKTTCQYKSFQESADYSQEDETVSHERFSKNTQRYKKKSNDPQWVKFPRSPISFTSFVPVKPPNHYSACNACGDAGKPWVVSRAQIPKPTGQSCPPYDSHCQGSPSIFVSYQ